MPCGKIRLGHRERDLMDNAKGLPYSEKLSRILSQILRLRSVMPGPSTPPRPSTPATASQEERFTPEKVPLPQEWQHYRQARDGSEVSTLVVFGAQALGAQRLTAWFRERPGFSNLQVRERVDAVFARFTSVAFAKAALEEANAERFGDRRIGAQWARKNVPLDGEQRSRRASWARPSASRSQALVVWTPSPERDRRSGKTGACPRTLR
jgi:hypothetical protein